MSAGAALRNSIYRSPGLILRRSVRFCRLWESFRKNFFYIAKSRVRPYTINIKVSAGTVREEAGGFQGMRGSGEVGICGDTAEAGVLNGWKESFGCRRREIDY